MLYRPMYCKFLLMHKLRRAAMWPGSARDRVLSLNSARPRARITAREPAAVARLAVRAVPGTVLAVCDRTPRECYGLFNLLRRSAMCLSAAAVARTGSTRLASS